MKLKKLNLVLGIITLSYLLHLESVIIPVYLNGFGVEGVSIRLSCIIWSLISIVSVIWLILRVAK